MKVRVLFLGRTNRSTDLERNLRVTWPGGSDVRADVVRASDLREACMHLYAVPFDAVLLDLAEDDHGPGVVERIRELDPDVPVVALGDVGGASACVGPGLPEVEVWAAILDAIQGVRSATHEHQA